MDILIKIIIVAGILGTTGLLAWFLHRFFQRQELRRRGRLNDVDHFDAIDVTERFSESVKSGRQRARNLISRRFTILRRTLVAALVISGLLCATFPFLGQMPATMLSIIAGAISVIIGIAAKPFLENFISGIVISLSDRLHVGDTVYIDGELGTIDDISLTHSIIKIWNWQRYIMPNSKMLNTPVKNCNNRESQLWTHIEFRTSYEENLEHLEESLASMIKQSEYIEPETDISLWPMELESGTVRYWLAAWANGPENAWYLRNDMRRSVISTLQQHGISSHEWNVSFNSSNQNKPDAINSISINDREEHALT